MPHNVEGHCRFCLRQWSADSKPFQQMILTFINLTLWNKFQWILNTKADIFMQENTFEDIAYKILDA